MIKSLYRFLSPKFQNVFLDYPVAFRPRFVVAGKKMQPLFDIVAQRNDVYASFLNSTLKYTAELSAIQLSETKKDENKPTWNNGFFPGMDIVNLYTMLREKQPNQFVEIGSGNSTKVVRKAIAEGKLATKLTSIDPMPRASIDHLADKVIREPLETLQDFSVFDSLGAGDILFIDNSHRCLPNSDVTVCFLEILPRLKKGVIVHVHDIYIPYDYPQFMCDRAYSEQYVLAAMVMSNPQRYQPLVPNFYISEAADLAKILEPHWAPQHMQSVERHGGSFWLEIG